MLLHVMFEACQMVECLTFKFFMCTIFLLRKIQQSMFFISEILLYVFEAHLCDVFFIAVELPNHPLMSYDIPSTHP